MSHAVYRGYDAEAMELQYNPRLTVPDVDGILADWAARIEAAVARGNCEIDLAYGPRAEEKLDLYKPNGYKPDGDGAPVLVFIHGGYWRALDKQPFAFMAAPLVAAGALVASINYTLCPAVTLDEIVRQARAACAWVWRNAAAHGGDPERLHVTGHSAGGHLTAMMAATDWPGFADDLPADLVKSATPISGVFELEAIRHTQINDDVRLDAAMAARNSPIAMTPAHDLPMTIAVGGAESDEFRRQSRALYDAWSQHLTDTAWLETEGEDHFSIIEGMTRPGSPLVAAILRHMGL